MLPLIFQVFYHSIGKILRLFQRSLIPTSQLPAATIKLTPLTVNELVEQSAVLDTVDYVIKNCKDALMFSQGRESIWRYCLDLRKSELDLGSTILEFGVWKGVSINFFARYSPGASIIGFDSFEGLEEDWFGHIRTKGFLDVGGVLPSVPGNVQLIKGWFQSTLPPFLDTFGEKKISVVHMDADTYTPTKYALLMLADNLKPGTIVIFDEYFGYSSWRLHEFKAWQEIISELNLKYKYLAYSDQCQVAVEIV